MNSKLFSRKTSFLIRLSLSSCLTLAHLSWRKCFWVSKTRWQKSDEATKTLNEDVGTLRKRVECPVCLEIPRSGPVFVCKNGHFVCQKCKRGGIMLLYSSSTTGILAQASSVSYLIGSANTYKLWRNLGRLYLWLGDFLGERNDEKWQRRIKYKLSIPLLWIIKRLDIQNNTCQSSGLNKWNHLEIETGSK